MLCALVPRTEQSRVRHAYQVCTTFLTWHMQVQFADLLLIDIATYYLKGDFGGPLLVRTGDGVTPGQNYDLVITRLVTVH